MMVDADVIYHGTGGRTAESLGKLDFGTVTDLGPHIIVLAVGGNDLCSDDASPLTVASYIHDLAVALSNTDKCQAVFVLSVTQRSYYPQVSPPYPVRVNECNSILRHLLEPEEEIYYYKAYGLYGGSQSIFLEDGIHLNPRGNYKLYRAVRGAVLQGMAIMEGSVAESLVRARIPATSPMLTEPPPT